MPSKEQSSLATDPKERRLTNCLKKEFELIILRKFQQNRKEHRPTIK